ncbi:molybdate ABC transporter substrate-binding protein [Saccharibacillus sp. CPCC 101409]|uniref:molybdate ABC transporter substrate-binding protein n=1 Tax=Saccharibacillus sp. CPCC 101409 TaxID=3058041 RepID=UPI002673F26D|nr:molybdate ABC transporter substrate-binding protein [Saccharibacillus sp. CPCC 101409]MDO3412335.1 molybdate ABC transporter substrate-binding protein [Saccharibacillus sp. CPCC 101409]
MSNLAKQTSGNGTNKKGRTTGRKINFLLLPLLALLLVLAACGAKPADQTAANQAAGSNNGTEAAETKPAAEKVTLTISAAASLTDALTDIQKTYEEANSNVKLEFNFGASGALQQQIEQGAPADLFLSASTKNMQALLDGGLIGTDKEKNWLTNTLVVVVPAEGGANVTKIEDLSAADVKHVAIGIPDSVPAGKYAQEALTNSKLWDSLQDKLVQGKDVRQVLQYTETGNADAGFVYKTDAMTSDKVKVAFDVDASTYSPINYPIGIVKSTGHEAEAQAFYDYLQTKEALDVLSGYGFSVAK